ncbi:MAG: hypothetical protein HYY16_02335 [Planctomycetes bacterium]|nr:hypothetical protein [Planctomycetota bacterium]
MPEALPHPDRVRVLLTDSRLPAQEIARIGDRFLEAGLPNVAVMFYERAKSADGLKQVKNLALKEGDEFLLTAVAKSDASLVEPSDWRACAEAALARGRFAFARDAFRKAGDDDRSAQAGQEYLKIFAG